MQIGLGIGAPFRVKWVPPLTEQIRSLLFDAGQVGGNLSFTDFSKIWQDSTGTTPYTAVEQYAGLLLNKAVPQVSNGTARVNVAVDSTNFASTATCVITNNKFVATAASGSHYYKSATISASLVCKIKVKVKAAEYTKLYLNDAANGAFYTSVDLAAKTYSGSGGSATDITVIDIGGGVVEIQMTATASVSGSWVTIIGYPDTGATLNAYGVQYTGDGVSGLYVYAVDVRLLSNEAILPAYQRIDNNVWVPYSSGCFYQATSAARPVVSARVNFLIDSEYISGVSGGGTLDSLTGYSAAAHISLGGANVSAYRTAVSQPPFPALYTISAAVKMDSGAAPAFIGAWNSATTDFSLLVCGFVPSGFTSTLLSSGIYRISTNFSLLSAGTTTSNGPVKAPTNSANGFTISGNDLRFASRNNLPYQKTTSSSYDTAGFPHYLKLDGIDDNIVSAAGGGGTAGIYYCGAIQFNKVGAVQTIFSDAGTNSGYKLRLTAANQLEISAGNGTAYTAINTTDTFAVGDVALCEFWDDGTNIGVRLGEGTPVTVARPVVAAGTAQITIGKDNNAASNYAGINMFEPVWRYGAMPNPSQREAIRVVCRAKARIV